MRCASCNLTYNLQEPNSEKERLDFVLAGDRPLPFVLDHDSRDIA